jgi:uncharacterized protein (DUF983 family)
MKPRKPSITAILKLRCPYCGVTPLQKTWFEFQEGCTDCGFKFEREVGYYNGGSGMILFPLVSVSMLCLAAILKWQLPQMTTFTILGICSATTLALSVLLFPYAMALWMYIDHRFNPIH